MLGLSSSETPASERLATFPPEFHVDKLLELVDVDGENGTEPLAFRPYDGALRAFAIVADPLTYWAPRVSDEAVDWLNTLTTIVEALVDAAAQQRLEQRQIVGRFERAAAPHPARPRHPQAVDEHDEVLLHGGIAQL